jgi:hypothetical protein
LMSSEVGLSPPRFNASDIIKLVTIFLGPPLVFYYYHVRYIL